MHFYCMKSDWVYICSISLNMWCMLHWSVTWLKYTVNTQCALHKQGFEVIFNPSLFGFVEVCFLSWLGLSHEVPSIIFVVVEWPVFPRDCPHLDTLDVGRRGSHMSAPLGVDECKMSMLLGWQAPPPWCYLRSKESREEGCRRCQGKISCSITHNLVVCLLCVKACIDGWPGGISDRLTPLWRGLCMHNFGLLSWVSSNYYKVISSKSLPLRPGLLWQPLWVDHLWELNLEPMDLKGQDCIVRAGSWSLFLWQ